MPTPDVSSDTVPEPSSKAPFHCVVAVRVVAMALCSLLYGLPTLSRGETGTPTVIRLYICRE
ncbi:hypothetical protein GCM10009733_004060 [Nonomuraea maheshkhaliensis]|uniref:Uncharacterized protein n=1 Tax=Nonomuraea maheshkhaliensis TaxID=419590 RepID=A0ABN2ENA0_9ACTN